MKHLIKLFEIEMEKISSPKMPEGTDSYTVVPHDKLVDMIRDKASDKFEGIPFLTTNLSKNGEQMSGMLSFPYENKHTGISVAFANSYNKRVKVMIAGGGYTWVCGNGSIFGEVTTSRKHTGFALDIIGENIDKVLKKAEEDYQNFIKNTESMSGIDVGDIEASRLIGVLRYHTNILSEREATFAHREWKKPTHFQERTLWGLYNACNGSLRTHHPTTTISKHRRLYDHFLSHLNLN